MSAAAPRQADPDPRELVRDRVVVVTGASSGIGRATAIAFAAAGSHVVGAARRGHALSELQAELERLGATAMMVPTDVTDEGSVGRLVDRTMARFGRLDVLVSSAGAYVRAPLPELTTADLERSLQVNFYGAVRPALAALPHLLAQGRGHLVFVSSLISRKGLPYESPYAVAKWALTGFADVARQELRPHGIAVTTVMPGRVATAFIEGVRFHPISKPIPPSDVAEAIVRAVRRRQAEVMLPRRASAIYYAAAVSPRLADWGVRRFRLEGWLETGEAPGRADPLAAGATLEDPEP
ncbi:MAG TPA: SDR family NAD(P)-dependent oxidoreductase [Candidatus Dormibacteraeota bacterium]|nr:SDR family NAD(P)-dependent oxidoreductase [Candidatus Dormibacteraeota bacterium]